MSTQTLEIKVARIHRIEGKGPILGYVDIVINDCLVIKGLKILEGNKGYFVTMPQEKAKDNKWYDIVRCLSPETRQYINEVVLASFDLSPD